MALHIDTNDPKYAAAAAEILRRHNAGEVEANITTSVRDFLITTGLVKSNEIKQENHPALGSRKAVDLTALDTFIEFKRRIGTAGGFNPDPKNVAPTRRLPGAVGKAGPRAHGHPDRRQVLAAALAQCRTGQDGPALRLHAGRPGRLDHPLRVAARPCPLCGREQAAVTRHSQGELRSQQPYVPARHRDPQGLIRGLRQLQHHQGQEAVVAEPAHGRPGRNSRRSRPDGRPVRPPYLPDRRHRHGGAGVLRQRHLPTGRDQPRRPPPRPRLPQQDGVAGRRGVRLLRLAHGGRRPAHAQDPRPPCRKVRLAEGPQRHRFHPVRDGHTARRAPPVGRVLHPGLAGQDHGARRW